MAFLSLLEMVPRTSLLWIAMGCHWAESVRFSHLPAYITASELDNFRSNANTDAVLIAVVAMMFSLLRGLNINFLRLWLIVVLAEIPVTIDVVKPENLLQVANPMGAEPLPHSIYRLHEAKGGIGVARARHFYAFIKWRDGFKSGRDGHKPATARLGNPLPGRLGFWRQRFAVF